MKKMQVYSGFLETGVINLVVHVSHNRLYCFFYQRIQREVEGEYVKRVSVW